MLSYRKIFFLGFGIATRIKKLELGGDLVPLELSLVESLPIPQNPLENLNKNN